MPSPTPATDPRPVIARFVHHTWMMDVTIVRQFLGPDLYLAAVFDAFSRVPLALNVFDRGHARPTWRASSARPSAPSATPST